MPTPPNDLYVNAVIQHCTLKDNSADKEITIVMVRLMALCFAEERCTNRVETMGTREHTHGAAMRNKTKNKYNTTNTFGNATSTFHMMIHFCMIGSQASTSMIYLKLIFCVC